MLRHRVGTLCQNLAPKVPHNGLIEREAARNTYMLGGLGRLGQQLPSYSVYSAHTIATRACLSLPGQSF